jgi:hypothetical protein
MSKDVVVERHNNTSSLSTSAVSATSKTSKSSQNNSMSKCPYMNLNSANEDSVNSMIDDNDDGDDDDDSRADMTVNNIHSTHMHKKGCTSPKNTRVTPTVTPTTSTNTYTSTATRPFVIQKNTQIVMFPSDWKHDQSWSVFGAGKRACPGTSSLYAV